MFIDQHIPRVLGTLSGNADKDQIYISYNKSSIMPSSRDSALPESAVWLFWAQCSVASFSTMSKCGSEPRALGVQGWSSLLLISVIPALFPSCVPFASRPFSF